MGKSVIINQDKLLMLKETMASNGKVVSHKDICVNEAAPEVDEYEIGAEEDSPVGGAYYHVNESANFDTSEIGGVNYSWDFDEEEYQEWLADYEYENTQESLMEYINDNVEFELEYLDNDTFHECGRDYVDYNTLEDMFGSRIQNEILTTCMNNGSGSFETIEMFSDDDVDINNQNSVNDIAMKLLRHGDYFKGCRGFILTNGVVVYTESEHNEICKIPNVNNKFDFIRMGNIRVLSQSIDIGAEPTNEQRDVLRRVIASYSDEELYLDIYQGKSCIGVRYIRPQWRYVMGEIDRYFSEGIKPQGNDFYENKKPKKQIVENKYDELYNKVSSDLMNFMKQGALKYGDNSWYEEQYMKFKHPEIKVDPKDIKIYKALEKKHREIFKLWNEEDDREEEESKKNIEYYDVIPLAVKRYGITSSLSQAGYILPDGRLLSFGSDGYRDVDHRAIERIYKENNIPIWSDEYRYNYVVDFMNHGAIRCDVGTGILDMTQEPTSEQYNTIKSFVRKAVDIDIDFTDDKGNTLHSVSYSDARPQQVAADIRRYYEDGIKPMGNVQYENKNMNNSHLIIESQESKSIAAAKKLVMQRLGYNSQEADEFIRIKLRNDIPSLRTPQGGKFILGVTRMFCDGELRSANDIGNLNSTLKLVASDAHINEYDRNLNNLSCQELIQRFAKAMSDNLDAEKDEVNQMAFDSPSDYEIVRIDSFEQAEEYGDYVSWCVTHDESMFNSYTSNGINQFYFCLKNGFENVEEVESEGCPLDEYGLSMIAVSVNGNGMLNTCTCRWNHDNGGDDSIMDAKEISQVIGMNFFEVFKPNNKWKELLASVTQRLENGENPRDVFDYVYSFKEGFAMVQLKDKWNFINQEYRFLSDQWFHDADNFNNGFAEVELNGKWYKIDANGKLYEGKNKRKNIIISENKIKLLKENLDLEVDSSEIDLSSFKKKDELVPSIWDEDDKLNSKIRLKLLDIADDFWDFVNLKWVKPKGVILTGSICNFNWSKYSDIDLHIIADFNEIDEKTEFVRDYLDSKKNEWNNEHNSLEIMGYKVELYVQDLDEMPQSSGIYDLEENDWISKPNPNDIEAIGMNKYQIKEKAAKIMTIIDDMFDMLTSTSDSHKIEEISNDADYLWKKVKGMRKSSLEKDGEMGSGNIVYKYMRRKGYLDKLWKLRTMCYDKSNSIMEDKNIVQYITSLKNSFINEEFALDGNTEHNPYKDRWKAEREALKNYISHYGVVMQSKEDNKEGKLYKVLWDKSISQLIGYNYCLCVQWDEIKLKPKSVVYVRAMDKFTPNIRRNITFDNRGLDNQARTWDDVRY